LQDLKFSFTRFGCHVLLPSNLLHRHSRECGSPVLNKLDSRFRGNDKTFIPPLDSIDATL
jgi:hypothetical protein